MCGADTACTQRQARSGASRITWVSRFRRQWRRCVAGWQGGGWQPVARTGRAEADPLRGVDVGTARAVGGPIDGLHRGSHSRILDLRRRRHPTAVSPDVRGGAHTPASDTMAAAAGHRRRWQCRRLLLRGLTIDARSKFSTSSPLVLPPQRQLICALCWRRRWRWRELLPRGCWSRFRCRRGRLHAIGSLDLVGLD